MPDAALTPGLDLPAVLTWLARAGVPLAEPVTAQLFTGGRSNVTYRLTAADGRTVVLRRPPLGNVMPSAHDMGREHRVLTGLARVSFPTPAPLALCDDEAVTGAPFLVMSYVPGRIVDTAAAAAKLTAADRGAISDSLVTALAGLHRVDVHAAGLEQLGRPQGYLPRQLTRWSQQWDITRTRDLPAMDELRARIERGLDATPPAPAWSLVHGDYRLDNVILDPVDLQVSAVLDWEMSTLGDPIADLAVALVYWSQPGDALRHAVPVAEHVTDADGFWTRERLIEAYAQRSGLPLDHLDVCTALACFKLAVIMESIHARALSGKQLGAARDSDMGAATEALAQLGLAVTRLGTVAGLAA
jgi:aminoglycoside phosphotransferase (APT) family kinase protein